jgi:ComF family protein
MKEIDLCEPCQNDLPWIQDRCYRCCLRLGQEQESILCESCQNTPPPFDRMCALFSYDPPVRRLVTGLKFSNQLAYGRVLGELLAQEVESWYDNLALPEAVIPVPLHPDRLRKRGYNQALELLNPLKKKKLITLLPHACLRKRRTKPQSGLNAERRRVNLKNAFQVCLDKPYQHIAVMDDVITTGTTVNTLSAELKKAGVEQVDVWCICRA